MHWIEDRFCTLNEKARHKRFEILDVHAGCQFNQILWFFFRIMFKEYENDSSFEIVDISFTQASRSKSL